MKTTIMEYGLTMIAAIVLAAILVTSSAMFGNGGDGNEAIKNYISTIC